MLGDWTWENVLWLCSEFFVLKQDHQILFQNTVLNLSV